MKKSMACEANRLATFGSTAAGRRTSSRSKKLPAWPHELPAAKDLAWAGFVWKPTSESTDNVQCFHCACSLDGWEPHDIPIYEHLTHSPNCAIANIIGIRADADNPNAAHHDPSSERIVAMRRNTFRDNEGKDIWPLDSNEGYPSIDQMVEGGFYYDPASDAADAATCPYCSVGLDAWDQGDIPLDEHQKRMPDCKFFALQKLFHQAEIPDVDDSVMSVGKAGKKSKEGKRTSKASTTGGRTTRQSITIQDHIASAIDNYAFPQPPSKTAASSKAPKASKATKAKRTKRGVDSDVEPESDYNKPLPAIPIDDSIVADPMIVDDDLDASVIVVPKKAANPAGKRAGRGRTASKQSKRDSNMSIMSTSTRQTRRNKGAADESMLSILSAAPSTRMTRGHKRTSDELDDQPELQLNVEPTPKAKQSPLRKLKNLVQPEAEPEPAAKPVKARKAATKKVIREEVEAQQQPTRATRGKKRVSEESDVQPTKRTKRTSNASNATHDKIDGANTQLDSLDWPSAELNKSAFTSTPRLGPIAAPSPIVMPTPRQDPVVAPPLSVDASTPRQRQFDHSTPSDPFTTSAVSGAAMASTPKQTTPKRSPAKEMGWAPTDVETFFEDFSNELMGTNLTAAEKQMTIKEYLMHNAKQAEDALRSNCHRQIELLEREGRRALEVMAVIPVGE